MNLNLLNHTASTQQSSRDLADGLRCTLNRKYGTLFHAAQKQWERNYAGKDPSDACVSVRISAGLSQRSLAA